MTIQRRCETYRGYQILVERVADENGHVRFRRTITQRRGERYISAYERVESESCPILASERTFADAIRDAREVVNRLLGGWHPFYLPTDSLAVSSEVLANYRPTDGYTRET